MMSAAVATSPAAWPKDYVPTSESAHALYQLNLAGFEGPLDLLLFLIKRHQLDIFDIPIAFICERYLDCLAAMQGVQIDVASEFLAMASELLHIKSRLLLPPDPCEADAEQEEDPRARLMERLVAYKIFRGATDSLTALPQLGRDVFARAPQPAAPGLPALAPALVAGGPIALTQAFLAVLRRQVPAAMHAVTLEGVSIRQRMLAVLEGLGDAASMAFADISAPERDALAVLVTFLAVLEMARLQLLRLYVSESGQLYLQPRFTCGQDALARIAGADDAHYRG